MGDLTKVAIVPYPSLRKGIAILFTGQDVQKDADGKTVLDDNGDSVPVSEFVNIELVVPPLNLESLQELELPLSQLKDMTPGAALAVLGKAIRQALRRNYRGVPDWLVTQSLDIGNLEDISIALMDVNGMRRKEIDAGKATAAAALLTGTQSSASSSPILGTPQP